MVLAYVGLGANLGDRRASLTRAVEALRAFPDSRVGGVSTIREYAAVGGPPQPPYLNAAAALETTLPPRQLLDQFQALEAAAGRARPDAVRWGPRPLDLDLLLYGNLIMDEPDLIIPHPRLADRLFVLEPLIEIAPHARHPILHLTVQELFDRLRRGEGVLPELTEAERAGVPPSGGTSEAECAVPKFPLGNLRRGPGNTLPEAGAAR